MISTEVLMKRRVQLLKICIKVINEESRNKERNIKVDIYFLILKI